MKGTVLNVDGVLSRPSHLHRPRAAQFRVSRITVGRYIAPEIGIITVPLDAK
jgi:hypothetical protein